MAASFHAVTNLDEIVARMIAPGQRQIALKVEAAAKRHAPPTKRWISLMDGAERKQHNHAHATEVPSNIRFELPAYKWDAEHPGAKGPLRKGTAGGGIGDHRDAPMAPGEKSYLLYPRDQSAGAFVAVVNCRCFLETNPDGVRKLIKTEKTTTLGTKVTTKVVAVGDWVVESENGDEYPHDIPPAIGAKFMHKGMYEVAGKLKRS